MATVKYGALELIPAPLVGISVKSNFFGADIRYSRSKVYSLKGTLLNNEQNNISGTFLQQRDLVTGFASDYLPFSINGIIVGYPKVNTISFDESNYLLKDGYNLELEFLESGNPFQITGTYYGFTGVTGLFQNIQSLSETLDYNTDFRSFNYKHSIDISYRTGVNVDPLLNSKIIVSGLINNKASFPFTISGGQTVNKVYEEKTDVLNGTYSVTENAIVATGVNSYNHNYSVGVKLDENGITTVNQNGNIQGFDGFNKYSNAESGYNVIRNTIYQNCSGVYANYFLGLLNNTYLTDSRIDNVLEGQISYSRSFNDATGISDTRWVYTNQIQLQGNKIQVGERGTIDGLGHISVRFNQASGFFEIIKPTILQRVLEQYSGFGSTGTLYPISREQGYDRFHGSINYDYEFSNNNNFGLGSGISSLDSSIQDSPPIHARVGFNVVHVGTLLQSLGSTKQGERNISLTIQAFRETPNTGVLQFITNTLNKYRTTGIQFIDPFISNISLTQDPITNYWTAQSKITFGGIKTDLDLNI